MPRSLAFPVLLVSVCLALSGCAARRSSPPQAAGSPAPQSPAPAAAGPEAAGAPAEAPPVAVAADKPSLRELCRLEAPDSRDKLAGVDVARRRLQETVCGANLWFDGLFGGRPDIENARAVSGTLELSDIYRQAEGNDTAARLRLNYELPTLKHRVNLFLGRGDQRELIEDRIEGLAVRSSLAGLGNEEDWLAGFGYRPPGKWAERIDFRFGSRLKTNPELYVQARYARNYFIGRESALRLRETLFWENREDGFGGTTSLDFDHLLRPRLLFRWANVATLSQGTDGTRWRTQWLLYQSLKQRRALLYQLFVRGETAADVPLREFGGQAVLRLPIGRTWLFGNFTAGYSWPRFELEDRRDGSVLVGFGIELQFGDNPY